MARLYVVLDEASGNIVRSGFFGQQLFRSLDDAEAVAAKDDEYRVHDVDPR